MRRKDKVELRKQLIAFLATLGIKITYLSVCIRKSQGFPLTFKKV